MASIGCRESANHSALSFISKVQTELTPLHRQHIRKVRNDFLPDLSLTGTYTTQGIGALYDNSGFLAGTGGFGTSLSQMFGFGKAKAVVGLDIGSSAVKAVELKISGKGFKVTAAQVRDIAQKKLQDLNAGSLDNATRIIAGTARSLGLAVEG